MIKFYDTCSLLQLQEDAFQTEFWISNITLVELENIKNSSTKDEETKWRTRHLLHLMENNKEKVNIFIYGADWDEDIKENNLILNNDARIIISAIHLEQDIKKDVVFITSDLSCKYMAMFMGLHTRFLNRNKVDIYTGYKVKKLNEEELATFYSEAFKNNENVFKLLTNEYLLLYTEKDNELVDKYKWAGDHYEKVDFIKIETKMFGKIVPKDIYQQLAMDSISSNQFTMITGPAGSGKDHIGLGYLFSLLEKGKIDKIFIFVNPVATKGAAKLGYLPGDKNSKILDSQIGNFLIGKLGSLEIVYQMIDKGQLVLMPLSDIRGVDLSDTHAALYITEAQNMSISMMKLALQRVGEDTLVIINGDTECQVDLQDYAGSNNGMKRVSKIFRGQDYFGQVTLKEIYRSRITKQADLM